MPPCKQPKKECPWNYKLIMSLVTVIVLIVSGIITAHAITIRAVSRNETKSAQNEKDLTRHEETILRNESKTDRAIEATRTDLKAIRYAQSQMSKDIAVLIDYQKRNRP